MLQEIRLNKYIQQQGIASRRKSDELIAQGAVKVNGKVVTEMGVKIDPSKDVVVVAEKTLNKLEQKRVYYKLNKPTGLECVIKESPEGTIYEVMPHVEDGVTYVGRLDKMSEGLLIMTNDGRLVYKMTHPKFEKEKEYEVTAAHPITDYDLQDMEDEFRFDGYVTKPAEVYRISSRKFGIILKEGRNRQIRRMCRKLNIKIHKLKRIRVGEILLDDLELGESRKLNDQEMKYVKKLLNTKA
jgi:pseudouridine synthase